ncbi:MAG TPA: shikimate dehydrogenase, partial [Rhodobacteraceae bacterium]|nr:shikimate dehydrogenase [Paracoccaceae bacterium]
NTLSFSEDGKIYADNTDGYGFIENIKDHQPNWNAASGPALVLGAGGASRAVLSALIEAGAPEIYLANRTRARADQLKTDLGARIHVLDWSKASEILDGIDLMVNTTSLGMVGKPDLSLSLKNLTSKTLVTDLVYTPLETDLLKQANAIGCPVVDGLGMLIHQAVPGFERWFGKKPTVDQETRNLLLS